MHTSYLGSASQYEKGRTKIRPFSYSLLNLKDEPTERGLTLNSGSPKNDTFFGVKEQGRWFASLQSKPGGTCVRRSNWGSQEQSKSNRIWTAFYGRK